MGTLRVTQRVIVNRILNNLQQQQQGLLGLQEQLASGQRILSPSDDPIDARRSINTRSALAATEQYLRNISSSAALLSETETVLSTVSENLQRARELALQGSNGTYSQNQLDSMAEEVNEILEALLDTGNQMFGGRYIFGGTRTSSAPFEAARDADGEITAVTYAGNGETIEVTIGQGSTIALNEAGDKVFLNTQDIYQVIIGIRDDLRSGDQTALSETRLNELDAAIQQNSQATARFGAKQNRLNRAESALEDFVLVLDEQLSDSLDADFSEVIVELNAQSNAYQAALSAASQVIAPSLLDYL